MQPCWAEETSSKNIKKKSNQPQILNGLHMQKRLHNHLTDVHQWEEIKYICTVMNVTRPELIINHTPIRPVKIQIHVCNWTA